MSAKRGMLRLSDQELAGLNLKGSKPAAPKPASKTGVQSMQALGRLPPGTMNKTETRFAEYLAMRSLAGEVLWWKFEGIRLVLAPKTSITIDFAVMVKSGELHMIDVKGSLAILSDDAHAKTKIAAATFPFAFFYAVPRGRTGHEWDVTPVLASDA